MADEALSLCLNSCAASLTSTCVQDCLETSGYTVESSGGSGIPLAVSISLAPILITFSALFSGLTLGLLSLDLVTLQVLERAGTPSEQKCAKKIIPVRRKGNLLLCTLLLGNTLVNSGVSILLADLTSGIVGLLSSVFLVLIFGEIVPQAVCARHGLFIGARALWIVKFFLVIFLPITFPIAWILNKALGRDIGNVYSLEEIKHLLELHTTDPDAQAESGLTASDHRLLLGALEYKDKCARDIMTQLELCFMLEASQRLTFTLMMQIYKSGYTRIPVYRGQRHHVVGLLYSKDLILVDPNDEIEISTVLSFRQPHRGRVSEDTKLDRLLQQFLASGEHLMLVYAHPSGNGDSESIALGSKDTSTHGGGAFSKISNKIKDVVALPSGPTEVELKDVPSKPPSSSAGTIVRLSAVENNYIGIVTLEDVLEELIKSEIVDESDLWEDVNARVPRSLTQRRTDMDAFLQMFERRARSGKPGLEVPEVSAVAAFMALKVEEVALLATAAGALEKFIRTGEVLEWASAGDEIDGDQGAVAMEAAAGPAGATLSSVSTVKKRDNELKLQLYRRAERSHHFTLILQGKVRVQTSSEEFCFELGPWSVLGNSALTRKDYVPDFSAVAVPPCRLLRLEREAYEAALKSLLPSSVSMSPSKKAE